MSIKLKDSYPHLQSQYKQETNEYLDGMILGIILVFLFLL